jgi:hypothetical protein
MKEATMQSWLVKTKGRGRDMSDVATAVAAGPGVWDEREATQRAEEAAPTVGSFATGLAKREPRPWVKTQIVADRLPRRVQPFAARRAEETAATVGSFATGLAKREPRPWVKTQIVADRLPRGVQPFAVDQARSRAA